LQIGLLFVRFNYFNELITSTLSLIQLHPVQNYVKPFQLFSYITVNGVVIYNADLGT